MLRLSIGLFFAFSAILCCKDQIDYCDWFTKEECRIDWVKADCQKYCGLCGTTGGQTTTAPQPPTPTGCQNKIDFCDWFKKEGCKTSTWLKTDCPNLCGTCGTTDSKTTLAPQPPTPSQSTTQGPQPPPGSCGVSQVSQGRVIGGVDAKPGAWPWQIGMMFNGQFYCGGSLVNANWIVTAAHCLDQRQPDDFKITLGDHDHRVAENEQVIAVDRIVMHPGYNSAVSINNDIGLIRLKRPALFNSRVLPVCLPGKYEKPTVGSKCYITGWGKIKHPGNSHPVLQQAPLTIQTKEKCNETNGKYFPITDQMLCGYTSGSIQSGCHGDSGGPFVCHQSDGTWKLQGSVSWGSPTCDTTDSYTVFARVAQFRTWINQYIGN